MSHLPNILTLMRLAAAPVLVVLLRDERHALALALFVIAGLSDGLDGYIAKRYSHVSRLGAILDPVADKVLIVSAYVMLTLLGLVPFWLLVTVVFRDLLIVGGCLMLFILNGSVQMRPSPISKLNTFLQITLVIVVLVHATDWISLGPAVTLLIAAVFTTTVLSGVHYLWIWVIRRHMPATMRQDDGDG